MTNTKLSGEIIFAAQKRVKEKTYWMERFEGFRQENEAARPHHTQTDAYKPEPMYFSLPKDAAEWLLRGSNGSDQLLHMLLTASVALFLRKYRNSDRLSVGIPLNRQSGTGDMLSKALPIRMELATDISIKEAIYEVRNAIKQAYDHQHYPIWKIAEDLGFSIEDRFPLFDTAVVLENLQDITYLDGLNPDHIFSFERTAIGVNAVLYYNVFNCTQPEAELIIRYFNQLLVQLPDTHRTVGSLSLLDAAARRWILESGEGSAVPDAGGSIVSLFKKNVLSAPRQTALLTSHSTITFKDLDISSDQVANMLVQKGIGKGQTVAVEVSREPDYVIYVMGVLKTGAAFLPVDFCQPAERIQFMIREAGTSLILAANSRISLVKPGIFSPQVVRLDPADAPAVRSDDRMLPMPEGQDTAYTIYTSGSTGQPKGVAITHDAICNLVYGLEKEIYARYTDRPLTLGLLSSYIFDASMQHLFASLVLGHRLAIASDQQRQSGEAILQFYRQANVDISDGTPAYFRMIVQELSQRPPEQLRLRHFVIGGEAFPKIDARRFLSLPMAEKVGLTNVYGPTECTVNATFYHVNRSFDEGDETILPIGRPLPGYRILLLDKDSGIVPAGLQGEIHIGGKGVSPGYLRKELNHDRFIENITGDGDRWYRTGDLGKWDSNGNLHFVRRIDSQVKVNGYRIELEEVKQAMLRLPGIEEALIRVWRQEEDNILTGFYLGSDSPDQQDCRASLLRALPVYMVPTILLKVDEWPLTRSGKVDVDALFLAASRQVLAADDAGPLSELEEKLVVIWKDVLKIDHVPATANFFNIGGDSIRLIRMLNRLRGDLGISLQLTDIYEHETVRELARLIDRNQTITNQR